MSQKTDKKQESKNNTEQTQSKSISWRAAEFRYVEKGPFWYLIVIVISLVCIIFAIIQKNFFFGFFVLIATTVVFYFGRRRPKVLNFEINEEGIKIGKSILYRYDEIENFAIYERPQQLDELILKRKTMINSYMRIPIDSQLAPQVRSFLIQKLLNEVSYEPSFIDILNDWLGF